MLSAEKLARMRVPDERKKLDRMLGKIASQLPKLSEVISSKYLIHAGLTHQLTEFRSDRPRGVVESISEAKVAATPREVP